MSKNKKDTAQQILENALAHSQNINYNDSDFYNSYIKKLLEINHSSLHASSWGAAVQTSYAADQGLLGLLGNMPHSGVGNALAVGLSKSRDNVEIDVVRLKGELHKHETELEKIKKELDSERENRGNTEEQNNRFKQEIENLRGTLAGLIKKQDLLQLMSQVNVEAQDKLQRDDTFVDEFSIGQEHDCYVLAIDIRRSTELMLKAKSPSLFERFIIGLCNGLKDIVLNSYGIFDKFTGDGILAFFPRFYSGNDAGLNVLKAAFEAHDFFRRHYKSSRTCFTTVLKGVGLGIGIDYGRASLVRINTFTVVGHPVVYSCRLSGANPGETLINQPAYDELFSKYSGFFNVTESALNIKNEGEIVAYQVSSNGREIVCSHPSWTKSQENGKDRGASAGQCADESETKS